MPHEKSNFILFGQAPMVSTWMNFEKNTVYNCSLGNIELKTLKDESVKLEHTDVYLKIRYV